MPRLLLWFVTAPASWAAGFAVQRWAVSLGAGRLPSIGFGLIAFALVFVFIDGLINDIAAHRRRN
jgi:hypothetical protein